MLSSAQLKEAFDSFDKDKSQSLDTTEVARLAASLGVKTDSRAIEELFKTIDVDHDGRLSFDEFLAWYRVGKHTKLASMLKYQMQATRGIKLMDEKLNAARKGDV